MSLEATTWALNVQAGQATRKLILFGLANHAHKNGRNAWASLKTLAEYAECDRRTAIRHVTRLLEDGLIRVGDQDLVAHLPANRRPVVYDLAMTDATRVEWAREYSADLLDVDAAGVADLTPGCGDNLSPQPDEPGVTQPCRLPDPPGVTPGVTNPPPRGDTAVSHKLTTNPGTTPLTPVPGEPSCARPGPVPHPNCRGCGTTNRQLRAAADRAAADRRRAADAAAAAADRERRPDPGDPLAVAARQRARAELQGAR